MQQAVIARIALAGLALTVAASPVSAASYDCNSQWLSRAEYAICDDPTLSRLDERAARRFDQLAFRTSRFGQYLGLRHWQAAWGRKRNQCGQDRACISGHYRTQAQFLDRVQDCLNMRLTRQSCLRTTLTGEREVGRR
jgi:uncharacterized protein